MLVAWERNSSSLELWAIFNAHAFHIASFVYSHPLTARLCACWMTELTKNDSYLSVYFIAAGFLHVASRSLRHGFNDELMDILAAACGQFTDTRRYSNNSTSASEQSCQVDESRGK